MIDSCVFPGDLRVFKGSETDLMSALITATVAHDSYDMWCEITSLWPDADITQHAADADELERIVVHRA